MLHYTDTGGDGPALLLVHGVLMNETVWHKQVGAFRDTHRIITLDMAGFGKSPGTGEMSFADHVREIDALLAHLGLDGVTFVGWSMGGAVGQVMGHVAPGRLRRLVLIGTTPQLVADEAFDLALPPDAVAELGRAFESDFAAGCDGFAEACAGEDPASAAFLAKVMKGTDPAIGMASLASGGAQTQLGILDRIAVETHVIHGAEDAVCLPAAGAFLADSIAGSAGPVIAIDGAGHAPLLTRSEQFNEALRTTLNR